MVQRIRAEVLNLRYWVERLEVRFKILNLGWIRVSVKNSGLQTVGFSVYEFGDHDLGLNRQGARNEA